METRDWNNLFIEEVTKNGSQILVALIIAPNMETKTGFAMIHPQHDKSAEWKKILIDSMRSYLKDYDEGKIKL